MMKTALKTTLSCCLVFMVACSASAERAKIEDFKVKVSGVAVMPSDDCDDAKVGETGYRKGGAAKYAEHLLDIKRKRGLKF